MLSTAIMSSNVTKPKNEHSPLLGNSSTKISPPLFKVEEQDTDGRDEKVKGKMTEVKRQLFQEPAATQSNELLYLHGFKPKHLQEPETYFRTKDYYCRGTSIAYLKLMGAATKLVRANPGQKQNYRSKVFDEYMTINIGIGNKLLNFLHMCLPKKHEFEITPSMLEHPGMIWGNNDKESVYETFKPIGHINCSSNRVNKAILKLVGKMCQHNLDAVYCVVNVFQHVMAIHILRKGNTFEISTYDPARATPIKTKFNLDDLKNGNLVDFDSKYTFPTYFEPGILIRTFNIQVMIPKEDEDVKNFENVNLVNEVEFDISTERNILRQVEHLKYLFIVAARTVNTDLLRIGARSINSDKYPEIARAFDFNNESENGGRATRENLGAFCLNRVIAEDNCLEAVKILVEEAKVPVNSLGVYMASHLDDLTTNGARPTSPLLSAIRANNIIGSAFFGGNPEVVRYLLEQGADLSFPKHKPAYRFAMQYSDSKEIVDLMNEYADRQGIPRIPSKKFPPVDSRS